MYGFPIHELPAADRRALLDYLPAARAMKRELANGFKPATSEDIERHVLAITGSEEEAQAAVLAWRTYQVEHEIPVT